MRYTRNRIYISKEEQDKIRNCNVFLAGCGIGSVIAECALRLGFENLTIIDGDIVEESNLNRQNYQTKDIGLSKAQSILDRLKAINPLANISVHDLYLTEKDIEPLLFGKDIAINALDFKSDIPVLFDEYCQRANIPVLHPYNIGWAALLFIIKPDGPNLATISTNRVGFEKSVVNFFLTDEDGPNGFKRDWIGEVLEKYGCEPIKISPPQLSVASWLLGGLCTDIMFKLATDKPVKSFPEYYFLSGS